MIHSLEAYEINGSNYVKLRDIGQAADFSVTYDAAANSVRIEPDKPYTEEVKAPADPFADCTEENHTAGISARSTWF